MVIVIERLCGCDWAFQYCLYLHDWNLKVVLRLNTVDNKQLVLMMRAGQTCMFVSEKPTYNKDWRVAMQHAATITSCTEVFVCSWTTAKRLKSSNADQISCSMSDTTAFIETINTILKCYAMRNHLNWKLLIWRISLRTASNYLINI